MIWLLMALMTAAAVMAVLWPLSRRAAPARPASDVAVYTDQLDEIERDQRFGLIAPAEADAARIEVSRRLIAAADAAAVAARRAPAAASPRRRRAVALIALIALPAVALAVYLAIGSPELPGAPLAQRIAQARAGQRSVEEMFARVERHLEEHPEDGRGWELVAPIYMRLGRFDDAVKARRNVLRTLGPTPERWSALGEVLVARENGIVTDDAKAAFDSALKIDPKDVTARFYSGLAAEQDGRTADAARIWRALAADAPPGAPWLPSVQSALARVDPAAAAEPSDLASAGAVGAAERDDPRHGGAARRTPARRGRRQCRGLDPARALLRGAARARQGEGGRRRRAARARQRPRQARAARGRPPGDRRQRAAAGRERARSPPTRRRRRRRTSRAR